MFDNIPDDVPESYLSGAAAYVRSDGERKDGMTPREYAWVMNEIVGLARVNDPDGDGRSDQSVVSKDDAGDDALGPEAYTTTPFVSELEARAAYAMDTVETED